MSKGDSSERNSLLNSLFREYLREKPDSPDNNRKLRQRMRNRVRSGLEDIALLNQYAERDDIRQILQREQIDDISEPNQENPKGRGVMSETNWLSARHMVAFAWHGLRANGMDKERIFERVILQGIVDGEAKWKGVDTGQIEADGSLNTLKVHSDKDNMDPLEKWERGLGLSGEDVSELVDRLPEGTVVAGGRDIGDLIDEHLIEGQTDR